MSAVQPCLLLLPSWPQLRVQQTLYMTFYHRGCRMPAARCRSKHWSDGVRVTMPPLIVPQLPTAKEPGMSPEWQQLLMPFWGQPLTTELMPTSWPPRVESGAWLQALPMSSLGLRMDDDTLRVAAGLRLGATLCQPHNCQHCGGVVDEFALHGLSCRKRQGCHPRHAAIDMLLQRALASARGPSHLEPLGSCKLIGRDLMEPQ